MAAYPERDAEGCFAVFPPDALLAATEAELLLVAKAPLIVQPAKPGRAQHIEHAVVDQVREAIVDEGELVAIEAQAPASLLVVGDRHRIPRKLHALDAGPFPRVRIDRGGDVIPVADVEDRKSTRLNSSHVRI